MLFHAILSILLLKSIVVTAQTDLIQDRIVGGATVAIEKIPYQVGLVIQPGNYKCGGILFRKDWVITAAHCADPFQPKQIKVRAGTNSLDTNGGESQYVQSKFVHPKYNSTVSQDYDISLLKTASPFKLSNSIATIPLAPKMAPDGAIVTASGYGTLSSGGVIAKYLQSVQVVIINKDLCQKDYNNELTDRQFCAGTAKGGKDSCQGDSGGPLVYEGKLLGVISGGHSCALADYPGIYIDVPLLTNWILTTANNN